MPDPSMDPTGTTDFFISYRGAHSAWARWINWVVRSAGYSTVLMDEFPVGTTWTANMRHAAQNCRRLIPLYSADYWAPGACVEEFDAYWRQHLKNSKARFLLPLVIEDSNVPDMHAMLLASRLFSLDRDAAQQAIEKVLTGIVPVTPGLGCTEAEPPFPGATSPTVAAEWPETAPDNFRWPLADLLEARLAFASLVTRSTTKRLLAIRGESETGKSHLTRQFLANAQRRLPGCAAGRFDFKGTTDIAGGLRFFADQLAAPPPPEGDLAHRLSALVSSLGQRPALLIFDGYEFAGEADRWVRESLLTTLHSSPWLRVILAGQKVPDCRGHAWEEKSHTITLTPPAPEDWLTYALENQRPVNLALVKRIHALAGGRASAIAPLLGPRYAMDFAEELRILEAAAGGDNAHFSLAVVDLTYGDLPGPERERLRHALLAAAVPHWCDDAFLAALMDTTVEEAAALMTRLRGLSNVEPFPARGLGAVNVHEASRLPLREHLRTTQPDLWKTLATRARAHVASGKEPHARIEALYHLFAADPAAAAGECQRLSEAFRDAGHPEQESALALALKEFTTQDIGGKPLDSRRNIATITTAPLSGKHVVRFFVSYAHDNKTLAHALIKILRTQFSASRRYQIDIWIDGEIMVGTQWRLSIEGAIKDCDFGLFMVTPAFLGSDFIGKHEIPPFIGPGARKPVIPVAIEAVDFARHDLKGIEEHQLFNKGGRAFDDLRLPADKRQFGRLLYQEIERRLDDHFRRAAQARTTD